MGLRSVRERFGCPGFDSWRRVPIEIQEFVYRLTSQIADLEDRLERFESDRDVEVERLTRQLGSCEHALAEAEESIRVLRERLETNSQNSSLPPSRDPLSARKRRRKAPSSRRQHGGQPGHRFHPRRLVEPEQCRSVVDHVPDACGSCGSALEGRDPSPYRHQIIELPPIVPLVDEHRLHQLECSHCGAHTRAALPVGVSSKGFGPQVEAAASVLGLDCHASHRQTQRVLEHLLGVRVGLGSITALRRRASEAVSEAVEAARAFVKNASCTKYADETSWMQANLDGANDDERAAWVWAVATDLVTVFDIRLTRAASVARDLLGEQPRGVLVTDRYGVYRIAARRNRQVCWAHLMRDFERMAERAGPAKSVGEGLLECGRALFAGWHRYQSGTIKWVEWEYYSGRLRNAVAELLERGARYTKGADGQTGATCREILKLEPSLWVFARRRDVEPTSNRVERALRPAVLWRRVSFGSKSEEGSRFVARMLTVRETLRSQQRNPYAYLAQACEAAREHRPAPSLLPAQ